MSDRYRGYNGTVILDSESLEIVRSGFAAKMAKFDTRQQIIPFADISDLAYRRPTLLVNGYLRVAMRGAVARPLSPTEANTHPHAVTFTHGQRSEFDKLVLQLQTIISRNESGDKDRMTEGLLNESLASVSQIPRTEQEIADVVAYRPDLWEFKLFAGLLLSGMDRLKVKWHDNEFRYAKTTNQLEDAKQAINFLSDAVPRLANIGAGLERLLTPRNNRLAFGPPGTPGDPNRIEILADRLIQVYEGFLDWAAEIRGVAVIDELNDAFEIAAQLADEPLSSMRNFFESTAIEVERIANLSDRDALEEGAKFVLSLELNSDEGLVQDFANSLERARKVLKL